jgi:hypothetical protein
VDKTLIFAVFRYIAGLPWPRTSIYAVFTPRFYPQLAVDKNPRRRPFSTGFFLAKTSKRYMDLNQKHPPQVGGVFFRF